MALEKSILSKTQLVSCEMWMLLMLLIKHENEEQTVCNAYSRCVGNGFDMAVDAQWCMSSLELWIYLDGVI